MGINELAGGAAILGHYQRLMIRANMVRTKQCGIGLRERVLARPEAVGKMAGLTLGAGFK